VHESVERNRKGPTCNIKGAIYRFRFHGSTRLRDTPDHSGARGVSNNPCVENPRGGRGSMEG